MTSMALFAFSVPAAAAPHASHTPARAAAISVPARGRCRTGRVRLTAPAATPGSATPGTGDQAAAAAAAAAATSATDPAGPVASTPQSQPADTTTSDEENSGFYQGVPPAKVPLTPDELAEQKRALSIYADELRNKRIIQEVEDLRLFGWVPAAEKLNGRAAMFFIVTGLLTELWTGYSMPGQIQLLLETFGIL